VAAACKELEAAKLPATLMVDCSHANSSKQHEKQLRRGARHCRSDRWWLAQRVRRDDRKPPGGRVRRSSHRARTTRALEYGKSITDACLGWDDSLHALADLSQAVLARRQRAV
jgi:3-deoxy-7-phosphoheptulonate synthase